MFIEALNKKVKLTPTTNLNAETSKNEDLYYIKFTSKY